MFGLVAEGNSAQEVTNERTYRLGLLCVRESTSMAHTKIGSM